MNIEAKVAKIKALLAKTEDNGCTEAEAASAMAMAAELMQKWAIDEAALETEQTRYRGTHEVVDYSHSQPTQGEGWLAYAVSRAFFTHAVSSKNRKAFFFFGAAADVRIAAYVFSQLRYRLDWLSRERFKEHAAEYKRKYGRSVYSRSNAQAYRTKWIASWMAGAILEIERKLQAGKSTQQEALNAIVETKSALAKQTANQFFSNLRESRSHARVWCDPYEQGKKDGQEMDIHKGIGATHTPQLKGGDGD